MNMPAQVQTWAQKTLGLRILHKPGAVGRYYISASWPLNEQFVQLLHG